MKKAKRALALALVFALVASFCVTGAAADGGQTGQTPEELDYVKNDEAVTTDDDVIVSKTAEYVSENEYNITLEVTIPDNVTVPGTDTDVVLVIDCSNSMNDDGKLPSAKNAANGFADALLAESVTADVKLAVVSYAQDATTNQGLTDSATTVKQAVARIRADGGTNIQAGIHEAREILSSSTADKKVIVVLSDGEPTYSYPVKGTSGWSGCVDNVPLLGHSWYGIDLSGGPANINLPDKNAVTESDFDYTRTTGSGGSYDSGVYAILDVTCEHHETMEYDYSGREATFDNNGDPTIAEANFAREDGCEVYGLYLGKPNDNAKETMSGVADDEAHYMQASTTSLSALLQEIAGSVTSTTAGAVTDPMGNNITLGDVSDLADDGVTATGNGLTWNPTNGKMNQDGSTTYTVTYPITVDGEELTASGWVDANDTTTFSYSVNGELKTVDFNVPQVWGEKVETETPQDVYVYVKVVGENGADGNLTQDELEQAHAWGLTTLNNSGWYTIGVVYNCLLPPIPVPFDPNKNIYSEYKDAVDLGADSLIRFEDNKGFDITGVNWNDLHVADGADNYVGSGTACWHLDGTITLEDLKDRLVTVTYTDGVDDEVVFDDQVYDRIPGTATPAFNGTPTRKGFTFNGWRSSIDGQVYSADDLADMTVPNKDVTYTATWSRNTNEVYIKVYLDDEDVTAQYNTYLSGLSYTGTTTGVGTVRYDSTEAHIIVPYAYEDIDAADVKFSVNSGYVLQGVSGMFVYGSSDWDGVKIENGTWTVDNVDGGSTLKVYLNTKYSVEYEVPSGFTEPEADGNTYITVEGLQNVSAPDFTAVENDNEGREGGWTNNGLSTTITLSEDLPDGTTGWYDELTQAGQHKEGETIIVAEAVADKLNGDNNIFTFTATANEYTVTYTDGVEDEDVFVDQVNSDIKHGAETPGFNGKPEREGYTFEGWSPEVADTVTETVTYVAQWKEITGTLTVTKTFEGLVDGVLPEGFTITVTGTSGAADDDSYTLTIGMSGDENIDYSYDTTSGTHKWVISGAALGNYSVSESNTQVSGYKLDTSASTQSDTMTLTDTATSDSAELRNVYVKDNPGLGVDKTVYSVNGDTTVPEMVKVDDVIVYQIVVTNTGNVALEKISVTDTLGEETLTVYTDAACTTPATTFGLAVDESEQFYAQYKVTADDAEAGFVENTATAKAGEDGPEDSGKVTVNVTPQYTLTVNHRYDTQNGEVFEKTEETLNKGDEWSATAKEDVERDGMNYIFDASRSSEKLSGTISGEVTVDLVYVKDEWKDNPDGKDDDEGGDGTPDYQQALIKYEAETGGTVDPTINVETLTDDDSDGVYSGEVKAESTATANADSVFDGWTGPGDYTSVEAKLSHEFTAVGGETYTYTASFKTGTTGATIDKQLVSYTRGDAEPTDIPEDFKARVGDVLNYTITVKNTGEVALNTTVTDTITGNGDLTINNGEGYTVKDGVITINGLAPEGTVTITASYTVVAEDVGETITNTATVDMGDENPDDDPEDDVVVEVDDYSVTITPADIVAYTGGDGYSAVVGANDQYINNSTSGLPEPGYHVVLSDAVVDWLNDNGVDAGDGSESEAANLEDVLSFTYDDGTNKRNWSLRYVGVYSYNASGNPSAYVYSIVTETAGAPSVSLKYFDDLNEDGEADDNEVITSDDILMSANQVNHTYKMTIEGGDLDQSQVKAVLKAGGKSLTTDIDIGIGELTVLSTTDEETTNSIAGSAAGVDSGVITAVGNDSITYYVNESGVAFDDGDLVSRVQLLIDEVTNETSGEFETAMAEAAFDAVSAALRNAEYEMCYMDLVDTENGNAKVTFSGGELSIYWPLPDGASASDSFYIVHFTELDREHAAVGTDVLDTTNKDVIAGEVMRIGGEYYVTFDVGSFSPFVLVYGDEGGGRPIIPVSDPDDGDDEEEEFVPKWLNIDDHYAYIIGYEDGTVRPQGNITRAEVATIFFRLLTDEVREEYWSTESGYSDVKAGDWYNNAISTLSNLGVITGYEDGTFRPNASISRAEFVTIATRFFDYTAEYEGTFSDVSYLSWYADFVQAAVDMGLVNGYENGTFRPNASITRAEAVAIVNRVLLRRPDADHLLPWSVMNTFSDNVLESAWYYEDIQEATNSHDYEWLKSGVEDWTEKLPERDWAALEREWSSAYDAPGGEVTG